MSKKLIAVVGATGQQGGSVIQALLAHGGYSVRGISRDPTSASSRVLSDRGVDMVSGNLGDKDTLISAFNGASAVFGVTMPFSSVSEFEQGKNIVDACRACNVALLVWSSLQDAKLVSGGKYTKVTLWDEKARVEDYITEHGQDAVILQTATFVENIHTYHYLRPSVEGKWTLAWPVIRPTVPLAVTYIGADFGPCVVKAIEVWERGDRDKLGKKPIPVCSFRMTIGDMWETMKKLSGKTIEFQHIPRVPSEELQEMLQLADDGLAFPDLECP
ncbi:NAD(P)-binding protein, partial [Calocera cornea HHB12733]